MQTHTGLAKKVRTRTATATRSSSGIATQSGTGAKTAQRTRCEVWTRVMGYHRPVSQFNRGKKSEHSERTHFKESVSVKSTHVR